jgi:hypothetical protein
VELRQGCRLIGHIPVGLASRDAFTAEASCDPRRGRGEPRSEGIDEPDGAGGTLGTPRDRGTPIRAPTQPTSQTVELMFEEL